MSGCRNTGEKIHFPSNEWIKKAVTGITRRAEHHPEKEKGGRWIPG